MNGFFSGFKFLAPLFGVTISKQTQFSSDSVRFSIANSSFLRVQPALGEFDKVSGQGESSAVNNSVGSTDGISDSLGAYNQADFGAGRGAGWISTNTIFTIYNNPDISSRFFQRSTIIMSEEL